MSTGAAIVACTGRDVLHTPAIGSNAPAYEAIGLDGRRVSLAGLRGKVVLLNVWATWCQPCREEIPQLIALRREYASRDLALIGVSVDAAGMGADVRDFMQEHGMTYDVWLDPTKEFSVKFLTVGVPETFLVDRAGVIRWRKIGALSPADSSLALAIRSALAL